MRPRIDLVRSPRLVRRRFSLERLEDRRLMAGGTDVTIALDPTLDQFGDQIATIMAYGDASRAAFGIFDTGASAVTFSADDQAVFSELGTPIPIKLVGGALAGGIGGEIVGDVSHAGTILADGMKAAELSFDNDGFPIFNINFTENTAATDGIQAFVGTEAGSPDLPSITGTPLLHPTELHPGGLAAVVDMRGYLLDFSDVLPGLTIAMPDVRFGGPNSAITAEEGTTEPIRIALTPFGGDNFDDPGDLITDTYIETIQGVRPISESAQLAGQSFLFDTGAQLSVISTAAALALGFDLENPETSITVQGVAGSEEVPGYTLKELDVPTADGGVLRFTDIPVYVLDVAEGIDGILGMNAMNTASKFVFNPFDPAGASLTVTYFTNPDRGGDGGFGDELAALFSRHSKQLGATLNGKTLPSFAANATKSDVSLGVSTALPAPVYGQTQTFTVILPAGASGLVTLYDGKTKLDVAAVQNGRATLRTRPLAVGSHDFSVSYTGDFRNNPGKSSSQRVNVARASTSVVLAAPAWVPVGQSLTLVSTVSASVPGGAVPTGSVIYLDGANVLGTAALVGGKASLGARFLSSAMHDVRAIYVGDVNYASASARAAIGVDASATATSLSAIATNVKVGRRMVPSYVFTIIVAPGSPLAGTPGGSVNLNVGSTTRTVALSGGRATVTLSAASVKGKTVVARYLGDAAFASSSSNALRIGRGR